MACRSSNGELFVDNSSFSRRYIPSTPDSGAFQQTVKLRRCALSSEARDESPGSPKDYLRCE